MNKKKLLIDMDARPDNFLALSLLLQSDQVEIAGISTACGYGSSYYAAQNIMGLLKTCKRQEIPVYCGCEFPMVSTLQAGRRDKKFLEQITGCPFRLPGLSERQNAQSGKASVWITQYLRGCTQKPTILLLGPATNLAVAMRMDPSITEKIERIVMVGGAIHCSDSGMAAEHNVWTDPEAARILFQSNVPITLYPLDCTGAESIQAEECAQLCGHEGRLEKIFRYLCEMTDTRMLSAGPALAASALVCSKDGEVRAPAYVEVAILPGVGDGDTVFDFKYIERRGLAPNAMVVLKADRSQLREMARVR